MFSAAILAVTACLFACSTAPEGGTAAPSGVDQSSGGELTSDAASAATGEPVADTVTLDVAVVSDSATVSDAEVDQETEETPPESDAGAATEDTSLTNGGDEADDVTTDALDDAASPLQDTESPSDADQLSDASGNPDSLDKPDSLEKPDVPPSKPDVGPNTDAVIGVPLDDVGPFDDAEGEEDGGKPGFPGFPNPQDAGPESDATEPSGAGLYLVSVDYYGTDLLKIDAETGDTTPICTLEYSTYPSLTFSRENVLYASRGGSSLDIIDPCTCEITSVGSYEGYSGVNGITSDYGLNLFGVANTQDEFIAISTSEGTAESIGSLGLNFGSTGATWSEEEQAVYAIDATTDALYTIAPDTGEATLVTALDMLFGITVGIEMHPGNGVIYACSDNANLLTVDPETGHVTDLGPMLHSGFCTNLAAPWQPVACLEEL
ncbi:MAG: hypothetical protein ACPGU1_03145 [Myxococcota bacterium]